MLEPSAPPPPFDDTPRGPPISPTLWARILENEDNEIVATDDMAYYCLLLIAQKLINEDPPEIYHFPDTSLAMHVTWLRKGLGGAFRGTAGSFQPLPIEDGLFDLALASAFHDERNTPPLVREELEQIQVTVSVLHRYEICRHYLDWIVGIHGLEVIVPGRNREGKLKLANMLPEFPIAKGWTRLETINYLIVQAGFIGKVTTYERKHAKIIRFRIQTVTKGMDDFRLYQFKKREQAEAEANALALKMYKEAMLARLKAACAKKDKPSNTYAIENHGLVFKPCSYITTRLTPFNSQASSRNPSSSSSRKSSSHSKRRSSGSRSKRIPESPQPGPSSASRRSILSGRVTPARAMTTIPEESETNLESNPTPGTSKAVPTLPPSSSTVGSTAHQSVEGLNSTKHSTIINNPADNAAENPAEE